MCLGIAVREPERVLGQGQHLGYEWVVVHNTMGYRCGYVRVPKGHPWHGVPYDNIEVSVHGGLTFSDRDTPCDKGQPDDGYWVGFDCAHGGDAPDIELMDARAEHITSLVGNWGGRVRSQEYVENECRLLCEQAAAATSKE